MDMMMQATVPTEIELIIPAVPSMPMAWKTRAVSSMVAMVMPETGVLLPPTMPTIRAVTAPKKQQIGEIIGVVVSAAAIGGVLILLNSAWGFGSKELSAPQATLMKMLVEGVMSGNLPWTLILIGVCLAVAVQLLGISVLPVAIGLYLPLELSTTVMLGGIVRWLVDWRNKKTGNKDEGGSLFCSGMVAGEGLVGILLAVLAVSGLAGKIDLSSLWTSGPAGGVILLLLLAAAVMKSGIAKRK